MDNQQIQNEINELKTKVIEEVRVQLDILQDQFDYAKRAGWTSDDLSDLILSETDILTAGVVEEESQLWIDIRDIQNSIIKNFGVVTELSHAHK